jgi:hypothetical protein
MTQTVDTLKAEGLYFEAGKLARKLGKDRHYGCHFGMRSTYDYAVSSFYQGFDAPADKPRLAPACNARIVQVLVHGAKGDLAFDVAGDIRYGWDAERDCRTAAGVGPVLVKNTRDALVITEAGLEWILENLQGCMTKNDERAALAFLKKNPDATRAYR